jgi:hypothetical protein
MAEEFVKVQDLKPTTAGHNLRVKVPGAGACDGPPDMPRRRRARRCAALARRAGALPPLAPAACPFLSLTWSRTAHTQVVESKTVVERPKLTVVESIVGDDTASIIFSAKNEQSASAAAGSQQRRHAAGGSRIPTSTWGAAACLAPQCSPHTPLPMQPSWSSRART